MLVYQKDHIDLPQRSNDRAAWRLKAVVNRVVGAANREGRQREGGVSRVGASIVRLRGGLPPAAHHVGDVAGDRVRRGGLVALQRGVGGGRARHGAEQGSG